jgi:hypothetical protein
MGLVVGQPTVAPSLVVGDRRLPAGPRRERLRFPTPVGVADLAYGDVAPTPQATRCVSPPAALHVPAVTKSGARLGANWAQGLGVRGARRGSPRCAWCVVVGGSPSVPQEHAVGRSIRESRPRRPQHAEWGTVGATHSLSVRRPTAMQGVAIRNRLAAPRNRLAAPRVIERQTMRREGAPCQVNRSGASG